MQVFAGAGSRGFGESENFIHSLTSSQAKRQPDTVSGCLVLYFFALLRSLTSLITSSATFLGHGR